MSPCWAIDACLFRHAPPFCPVPSRSLQYMTSHCAAGRAASAIARIQVAGLLTDNRNVTSIRPRLVTEACASGRGKRKQDCVISVCQEESARILVAGAPQCRGLPQAVAGFF